jgi:hypothetical protein
MKNALTPLIACAVALLAHIGGLFFFFALFSSSRQILAIPRALAVDGCVSTLLLSLLLFLGLRSKVRKDKGMRRLASQRAYRAARSVLKD